MPEPNAVVEYEKLLMIVGRYIQREHLSQVCVLEVQGGVIVQGLVPVQSGETIELVMRTKTFDRNALRELQRTAKGG
jgi:hypothetical protein